MAGEIYLSGLANSNFDYQVILQKYKQFKSLSIQKLQLDQQNLQQKQSAISQIEQKLKNFLDPISALQSSLTYQNKTAVLSNSNVADVSVTTDAVQGNYSLTVNSIAKASSWKLGTINKITDYNAVIPTSGTLTINYLKNGTPSSLSINYTNKSLKNIMDAVNASTDLKASIINLGTSSNPDYQLIITSKNTGTANAITSINDSANPGNDSAGVFSENTSNTYETVAAQDAQITLNGITFTNSTNTFSNVLTGVSITVKAVGSSNLSVQTDNSKIQGYLQDVIKGYNDLLTTVQKLTGKGQPLAGESTLMRIVSNLANTILDNLAKYGLVKSGVNGQHGQLSLDTTAFQNFMNRTDASTILQNFASTFNTSLSNYIDTTSRINNSYTQKINYLDKRISFLSNRLNAEIERMRQQFIKLEVYMSKMQEIQARIAGFSKNVQGGSIGG